LLEAVEAAFDDVASAVAFALLRPELDGPARLLATVSDLIVPLGDGHRDLVLPKPSPVGFGRVSLIGQEALRPQTGTPRLAPGSLPASPGA
jgi:hypothetical protein